VQALLPKLTATTRRHARVPLAAPSAEADIPTLPSRSFKIRSRRGAASKVPGSTPLPSAPRAGAAPTAGRVFFRAASSRPISNSGETLGASGGDVARFAYGCALPARTCEIVPSGAAPGSLSRLARPEAKFGTDAIFYTRSYRIYIRVSCIRQRRAHKLPRSGHWMQRHVAAPRAAVAGSVPLLRLQSAPTKVHGRREWN
jgi:hypothetical protein